MERPFSASTLFLGRAEGRGDNIFFFFWWTVNSFWYTPFPSFCHTFLTRPQPRHSRPTCLPGFYVLRKSQGRQISANTDLWPPKPAGRYTLRLSSDSVFPITRVLIIHSLPLAPLLPSFSASKKFRAKGHDIHQPTSSPSLSSPSTLIQTCPHPHSLQLLLPSFTTQRAP